MKRVFFACLSMSLLATAACRGGGGDDDDDGPSPDAPPTTRVKVQDVQNPAMPEGTLVTLEGVIVTAIDSFGARTGDLWVQDPAGGEFSGIKVFGAPLDQVAQLVPGDIVTITNAEKDEFALTEDTSGRTVTEIKGAAGGMMSITKTGSGPVPTPANVDAAVIGALATEAERDAEWEKWEGVLIKVNNVAQTGAVRTFGGGAEDQFAFNADGDLVVESVLGAIPATAVAGFCHSSITGIGDYFFDYLLLPRDAADFGASGNGCRVTLSAATIAEVQAGTKTGQVKLENVVVMALSFNKRNLWVASSLTGAANEGIFVFRGNGAAMLGADIVPGATVDVIGTAVEQNNDMNGDTVTQIASGPTVTFKAAPAGAPAPVTTQTAATLTVAGTGEPFESVLVTLNNVRVTAVGNMGNFFVGQLTQNGTTFLSDDDVFRLLDAELNKCYASITGIWTYQVFDNAYGFLPLAVGTGVGTCN